MLSEAVTELETVLNEIPAPSAADTKLKLKGLTGKKKLQGSSKKSEKKTQKAEEYDITQGTAKIDEIDVNYDDDIVDNNSSKNNEDTTIDINDEKVKDRWSRYIGAMGIDAVAK